MNTVENDDLEQWLQDCSGTIVDTNQDAPRAVTERLRFVAALLAELDKPVGGPALVFRPPGRAATVAPIHQKLTVGRTPPADVLVDDQRLSRNHFTIRHAENGHVLEDAHSRNGTYVNGRRERACHLRDGNIIEAGEQVFVFLDQLAAL